MTTINKAYSTNMCIPRCDKENFLYNVRLWSDREQILIGWIESWGNRQLTQTICDNSFYDDNDDKGKFQVGCTWWMFVLKKGVFTGSLEASWNKSNGVKRNLAKEGIWQIGNEFTLHWISFNPYFSLWTHNFCILM